MHLWYWFWDLSSSRNITEGGAEALSPALVRDWSELTGNRLRRSEYAIIRRMDAKFREAWAIEAQNNQAIIRDEEGR